MFSQDDFKGDTVIRLKIIINYRLGHTIMSEFKDLSPLKQKEFNIELNKYIKNLPDEWEQVVLQDFNEIVQSEVFHNLEAEKYNVAVGDTTLLLTEEQERMKISGELQI